jgi:5-methyltetrahydrofolate--homocysteine methyltransferase
MKFLEALNERVLIMDGAMGTMVQNLGLSDEAFGGPDFKMLTDLLVFARPKDLEEIHFEYLNAGANIIETDTFGASPLRLKEFDFTKIKSDDMEAVPADLCLKAADLNAIAYYLNLEACCIARKAINRYKALKGYDGRPLFVAGSIGPSNYVVASTQAELKEATFDEIIENSYRQVLGLIDGGADVLLYETQQDILELKAEIVGAHKAMNEKGIKVPIMAQTTVDQFSKMQIFNCDVQAAYVAISGMGIDVFGINCTCGPDEMSLTVEKMSKFCNLPFSVVPNAGQPESIDGKTCYKLEPEAMAEAVAPFVEQWGASIVGGCCGTTPDHIRKLAERINNVAPKKREKDENIYLSGPQNAYVLDSSRSLIRIGERLNVRGSKKVRDAVEGGDKIHSDVLEEVVREQVTDLGLDIIDVCMDSNIVETEKILPEIIYNLTSDFKGVMCLDSFSVEALEKAIDVYPGRPIINSISLEEYREGENKLDAVLSVTKRHAPIYIALVNGPEGPGITAEEKYNLAIEIVDQCKEKHGVDPSQILIDVNAYPIGSESIEGMNFCAETLKCIPRIKEIHPDLRTSIGVGNLTNGLAQKPYMRKVLTSVFLDEARKVGLDCAILNPNHYVPAENLPQDDAELARKVILYRDMEAFEELERIAITKKTGSVAKKTDYSELDLENRICQKIMDGYKQKEEGIIEKDGGRFPYKDKIAAEAAEAIDRHDPLTFISDYLMKSMRELGDRFGRGEVSLPHLLKSADVMRNVMGFLEAFMQFKTGVEPGEAIKYKGIVIIGTVYQDVHSIGKDLAKTLLENYGYKVVDLGVQVPLEKFIETARKENADAIGMSALLVQTSNHMITVSKMIKDGNFNFPILIGGAPVNWRHAGYVSMWGQDSLDNIRPDIFYCESAMDGVNVMNMLVNKEGRADFVKQNKKLLEKEYCKAKGMKDERERLLEKLKRRKISLKNHGPQVDEHGIHLAEFKIGKLRLDTKSLFSLNWKFGKQSNWEKKGVTKEYLDNLKDEWVKKAEESGWIKPRARFALLPAQSDGDELVIYDPIDSTLELNRILFNVCIGKGQKDKFSVAQYFHSKESGVMDVVGLALCTSGNEVDGVISNFKKENDSESGLLLQGLGDRVAEDLAEYIHNLLRQRLGIKKEKVGQRYSPGYAALEDMRNNQVIHEILKGQDIGVTLTGANEFDPPSTTGCIICFHKEAGYS